MIIFIHNKMSNPFKLQVNVSSPFSPITFASSNYVNLLSIDWGDNTTYSGANLQDPKTYTSAGVYDITLTYQPSTPITFIPQGLTDILIGVTQWPSNSFSQINFLDSVKLKSLPLNSPNFTTGAILTNFLKGCISFDAPVILDTINVVNMDSMFSGALIFNQSVNFNTSNVTNMNGMFSNTNKFNQPVNFNTSSVTSAYSMFHDALSFNQPIAFDTSNMTDIHSMFQNAINFNQDVGSMDLSSVTNLDDFLSGSGMSVLNFDNTLEGFAAQIPNINTNLHLGSLGLYYNDITSRNQLVTYGWNVSDPTYTSFVPAIEPAIPTVFLTNFLLKTLSVKGISKSSKGDNTLKLVKTGSNNGIFESQNYVLDAIESIIQNYASVDYRRYNVAVNGPNEIYIFYDPTSSQNILPSEDLLFYYLTHEPSYTSPVMAPISLSQTTLRNFIRYVSSQVFVQASSFIKKLYVDGVTTALCEDAKSPGGIDTCVENCIFTLSLAAS